MFKRFGAATALAFGITLAVAGQASAYNPQVIFCYLTNELCLEAVHQLEPNGQNYPEGGNPKYWCEGQYLYQDMDIR